MYYSIYNEVISKFCLTVLELLIRSIFCSSFCWACSCLLSLLPSCSISQLSIEAESSCSLEVLLCCCCLLICSKRSFKLGLLGRAGFCLVLSLGILGVSSGKGILKPIGGGCGLGGKFGGGHEGLSSIFSVFKRLLVEFES